MISQMGQLGGGKSRHKGKSRRVRLEPLAHLFHASFRAGQWNS
jgi:hypothetical protein